MRIPFFSAWIDRLVAKRLQLREEQDMAFDFKIRKMVTDHDERELQYQRERIKIEQEHNLALERQQNDFRDRLAKEQERMEKQTEEMQEKNRVASTNNKLMKAFKPFNKIPEHSMSEKLAIANMNQTLMEGIERISETLQQGMSNEAMRMVGDDHWRKLWMAFGVNCLMDALKGKQTMFAALKLKETKVKEVRIKQAKEQIEIRTMQHIYDRAPL